MDRRARRRARTSGTCSPRSLLLPVSLPLCPELSPRLSHLKTVMMSELISSEHHSTHSLPLLPPANLPTSPRHRGQTPLSASPGNVSGFLSQQPQPPQSIAINTASEPSSLYVSPARPPGPHTHTHVCWEQPCLVNPHQPFRGHLPLFLLFCTDLLYFFFLMLITWDLKQNTPHALYTGHLGKRRKPMILL